MLVPFIDNLASKCHAFWMTFLQSCHTHPSTSAQFSRTEPNSTLGQTTDSFILHQMWPSLTLVKAAVLYKLFQGYPFRIRAEAEVRRGNDSEAKWRINQLRIQRPQITLDVPQPTAAGLSHLAHGKNDQAASATQELYRAALAFQAPQQLLMQPICLPFPHCHRLDSNTEQWLATFPATLRGTSSSYHILSKSIWIFTHLLQVENYSNSTLYFLVHR